MNKLFNVCALLLLQASTLAAHPLKSESSHGSSIGVKKELDWITFSGRISASREASYGASIADAIAGSPLAEAIDAADEDLAGGRKLTEKVIKAKEFTAGCKRPVQGSRGGTGVRGATGPKGKTGPTGPIGNKGFTGSSGPSGPLGPTGMVGPQGGIGPAGGTGPELGSAFASLYSNDETLTVITAPFPLTVPFDTEDITPTGVTYTLPATSFKVSMTGLYLVNYSMTIARALGNVEMKGTIGLYQNNIDIAPLPNLGFEVSAFDGAQDQSLFVSQLVPLNAGEPIKLVISPLAQDTGMTATVTAQSINFTLISN